MVGFTFSQLLLTTPNSRNEISIISFTIFDFVVVADAHTQSSKLPKLLKSIEGSLRFCLYDFFYIFANEYEPENHIICPHFGKLFDRRTDCILDPDHKK